MKFFLEFRDEGEIIARFGDARLIRFLDGKMELRGGSNDDRTAAWEWMSMFWHERVAVESSGEARHVNNEASHSPEANEAQFAHVLIG